MEYTVDDVKKVLHLIMDEIIELKDELTEIDSRLGDGDMGISMEKGALALKKEVEAYGERDISRLFMNCAQAFNRAAPSTMGTLLSSAILMIAKQIRNQEKLTMREIVSFPQIMAGGIKVRGKASVGDKTILDALIPYADTLEAVYEETESIEEALTRAAEAAQKGVDSTKGIIAKTGRAKWLAERNMEYPDGGAVLCYRIGKKLASLSDGSKDSPSSLW